MGQLDLRTIGQAAQIGGLSEKALGPRKREVFQNVLRQLLTDPRERHFMLACDIEHDAAEHYRKWLVNLRLQDENSRRIFGLA